MGRPPRQSMHGACKIPIVDASLHIVGWTTQVPTVIGATLRHPEAEALVGSPIDAVYIELRGSAAIAAGAPSNWIGPWHCLALANQSIAEAILRSAPIPLAGERAAPKEH